MNIIIARCTNRFGTIRSGQRRAWQGICSWILVGSLLFVGAGCRTMLRPGAANHSADAASEEKTVVHKTERQLADERLDRVEAMMAAGKYAEAQDELAPLLSKRIMHDRVIRLSTMLTELRAQEAVKKAQQELSGALLQEVEEGLTLPESYGKTVVISRETEPERVQPGPLEQLINKPVSMSLTEAGVKELLLALADIDGLNVIADQSITADRKITVNVKNVPLRELLSYAARNMGLEFHLGANTLWVTKAAKPGPGGPELETRIFELRRGIIPQLAFAKKPQAGTDIDLPLPPESGPQDSELEEALKTFIGGAPDKPVYKIFPNRNLLIVRDTRENIRLVEQLLQSLDREPLQVLIEARFVTVRQSDLYQLGLDTNRILLPKAGTEVGFSDLANRDEVTITERKGNITKTTKTTFAEMPEALSKKRLEAIGNLPGQITISGIIGSTTYVAVLNALEQLGSARTLSAPRVTVANNHWARIHRGTQRFYFPEYSLEVVDLGDLGQGTKLVPTGEAKELNLGYIMDVKANIGNDGRTVMLALKPDITSFVDWEYFDTAKLPIVDKNTVATTVVVNSGDTVVLGGTLTKTEINSTRRVPFLADIPGIGWLFRQIERTDQPEYLLIFVTARVVDKEGRYVQIVPSDQPGRAGSPSSPPSGGPAFNH